MRIPRIKEPRVLAILTDGGQRNFMIVETKPCCVCGKTTTIIVDKSSFAAWQNGMLIQNAFPDMPKEEREMLISGTHPSCWKKLFSSEEEIQNTWE